MDKIAVLIPCYNESKTIKKVVEDYKRILPEATIYVYDNNSSDGTDKIAREAGAVVRYEYQQGKGNVIRRMFREIDAECYIMTDGDDTYPVEPTPDMAKMVLEQGVCIIMDNIFQYVFMQRAFVVAAIIAVIAPCIGVSIVLKRLSAIGDATSHSALAGIAFGLLLGINPILGAVMFSIFAVIGIEVFRKSFGKYSEIATVVVMSAGIGLTAVLSGFITNGSTNINSFLFGSIVAITDFELYLTIGLGIAVIITSILLYKELFFVTFDEEAAKLAGVPVGGINLVLMLLTAVTVSVASRIVGALMISSLLVIPVAAAMMIAKSYKQTIWWSIAFAEFFTVAGLFISYYLDLRPGGTIVLLGVVFLIVIMACTSKRRR